MPALRATRWGIAAGLLLVAGGISQFGGAAFGAVEMVDVDDDGPLDLSVERVDWDDEIGPGDTHVMLVTAQLKAGYAAHLYAELDSEGFLAERADAFWVTLTTCSIDWTETVPSTCGGVEQTFFDAAASDVDPEQNWNLGAISSTQKVRMKIEVSLPGNAPVELQGAEGRIGIGLTAAGDALHVGSRLVSCDLDGDGDVDRFDDHFDGDGDGIADLCQGDPGVNAASAAGTSSLASAGFDMRGPFWAGFLLIVAGGWVTWLSMRARQGAVERAVRRDPGW